MTASQMPMRGSQSSEGRLQSNDLAALQDVHFARDGVDGSMSP
jgi:hypothetical protein